MKNSKEKLRIAFVLLLFGVIIGMVILVAYLESHNKSDDSFRQMQQKEDVDV